MARTLLCIFAGAACVWGQNTTGTILGVVRDSSGAVIAGAEVRIANEATNIAVGVVTNTSGDYVATNLPAALYSVHAESPGFRKTLVEHVALLLNATQRQDLTLQAGALQHEIPLVPAAPGIPPETSALSTTAPPPPPLTPPPHSPPTPTSVLPAAAATPLPLAFSEYPRAHVPPARDFCATGLAKPQFNRNEFGLTLNGPVVRNRTFFSLSYECLRQRTGRPTNLNVP